MWPDYAHCLNTVYGQEHGANLERKLNNTAISLCTIDLDDRDRVMRVGCENIRIETVVDEVVRHGFLCEELND